MPNPIDLTGQKFGKLRVAMLHSLGARGKHGRKWQCTCDCGETLVVESGNLRSGNSTSCKQCRYRNARGTPKHGHRISDSKTSPTYRTWQAMRHRVLSDDKPEYTGIDMDPRWAEFGAFLADMGERPDGMTIDRRENAEGYWKHNCRWATPTEQTRNRGIARQFTAGGETLPIAEWAERLGLTYQTAYDRIRRHNSLD